MEHEQFDTNDPLKDIIRRGLTEQPSFDFANRIMAKIQSPESSLVYAYQPVISKKVWMALGVIVAGLFIFLSLSPSASTQPNGLSKYVQPAQSVLNNTVSGFMNSFTALHSLSWIVVVIAAGWLLFMADRAFAFKKA